MNLLSKKTIILLLAVCFAAILFPTAVFATDAEPVTFIDRLWDGSKVTETENTVTDYVLITPDTAVFEDGKTYVVTGSVTVNNRIECGNDVKLILTDGSVFNAEKGIRISGGSITIFGGPENSGELNAEANYDSTIGGNEGEAGGTVTVNGGTLDLTSNEGACISGTITINGGRIYAKSSTGAAIGSEDNGSCGTVTINDGYVSTQSYSGASIGSGEEGKCGAITINYGIITALSSHGGCIGSGIAGSCGTVTINGGLITGISQHGYAFRGAREFGKPAGAMPDIRIGQNAVLFYGKDSTEMNSCNYYVTPSSSDIKKKLTEQKYFNVNPISYVERTVNDDNSITETRRITYGARLINQDATELNGSGLNTYFISGKAVMKNRIEVKGNVNLILFDNSILEVPNGISVTDGNSLTIYGQENDTGKIIAKYGDNIDNAAIGGSLYTHSGPVTIHGGTVTAESYRCAGIGAGSGSSATITILGGNVTGISKGGGGIGRNVTIHGGSVKGTSQMGAGIGGGVAGVGGNILITGGTVEAGSEQGAGIGSGMRDKTIKLPDSSNITISGGTIIATSVTGAAIGKAEESNPAKITLGPGMVLNYGENASASLNSADANSGTPEEIAEMLSTAKYAKAEATGESTLASVFSRGSVGLIIGCSALLICVILVLLILSIKRKKIQE